MNIYEDEQVEIILDKITSQIGLLFLELISAGINKALTEQDIYTEFLEAKLQVKREDNQSF